MTDKEILIELLNEVTEEKDCPQMHEIADYLISHNVYVAEINPRTFYRAYFEAVYALADMVNQFAYTTTFRRKDAVCDGGLSALENAFWALNVCGCELTSNGKITRDRLFKFMEITEESKEKYSGV